VCTSIILNFAIKNFIIIIILRGCFSSHHVPKRERELCFGGKHLGKWSFRSLIWKG
jgi:hypothetical protein